MTDTAMLITAFSGLTVAVAALLVSLGVLYLLMRLGAAIESLGGGRLASIARQRSEERLSKKLSSLLFAFCPLLILPEDVAA